MIGLDKSTKKRRKMKNKIGREINYYEWKNTYKNVIPYGRNKKIVEV